MRIRERGRTWEAGAYPGGRYVRNFDSSTMPTPKRKSVSMVVSFS